MDSRALSGWFMLMDSSLTADLRGGLEAGVSHTTIPIPVVSLPLPFSRTLSLWILVNSLSGRTQLRAGLLSELFSLFSWSEKEPFLL